MVRDSNAGPVERKELQEPTNTSMQAVEAQTTGRAVSNETQEASPKHAKIVGGHCPHPVTNLCEQSGTGWNRCLQDNLTTT